MLFQQRPRFWYTLPMVTFKSIRLIILAAALLLVTAGHACATEEFARQTGKDCQSCHTNPLGGGELTAEGERFLSGLAASGTYRPMDALHKAGRLLAGYLHILAGVVWFGTIFYVHIILKPAYASKGLPRGELVLGWTCITVVGLTGVFLTYLRMPSPESFYATRFGVLLSVKILMYLMMAGTAALVTFVLGPRMKRRMEAVRKEGGVYTPGELHAFDGREGRPAFVAHNGVVYDLTGSRLWREGRHMRHLAGGDMTEALGQAPHGPEKLEAFPRAGRLASGAQKPPPGRAKAVFYFVAYTNLALVFLILGVIALWRWW